MKLGHIAFLGSGETSLAGGRIFETLARLLPTPLRVAIMETPAGFELNASLVAGRVADFLASRLQNYKPIIKLVPARKLGTEYSPDNPEILKPLLAAHMIFMGPGSPSYVTRQLRGTLAWDIIRAKHRSGATLVFASAATISVGAHGLPVYEIYKVGEEMHVKEGLNLFADYGLDLSFVPHWNNAEGGVDLDTSRCFMGLERFAQWRSMIPPSSVILGLDEHSGIIMDFEKQLCDVHGVSSVSVLKQNEMKIHPAGASFSFSDLGAFTLPANEQSGIRAEVWKMLESASQPEEEKPSERVLALLAQRKEARARKDFAESDRLRDAISALGWAVQDGKEGQKLVKV